MVIPKGGTPLPIIDDEQLSAYLDGDLSPTEQEAIRRAIQTDPAVEARYRELAATVSLLRALPPPALLRSFTLTADQVRDVRGADPTPLVLASPPQAAASLADSVNRAPLRAMPRVTRLTPLFGAFGAIAAMLLLVLISADFATGGFKTATPSRTASASIEQVTAAPPAATSAAVQAAPRAANGAPAAPAAPAAPVAAVATSASAPPAPATTSAANAPNRTSTTTTTSVPLALVRAVEIALAIIAVAGIVGAIQSARGRLRLTAHG